MTETSTWVLLAVMYALVAFLVFLGHAMWATWDGISAGERRRHARRAFMAPLWPILAVLAVWRGLAYLWHTADWRRP